MASLELEALVGHLFVVGGRGISSPSPGAIAMPPPRRAARGRDADTLFGLLTLGKGLGGGYPIAAFLTTEEVAKTVSLGDHGGTYIGSPLACAAANAVLEVVCEEKLPERAAELGEKVQERLRGFVADQPELASEVRGRGLLIGLVLRDDALVVNLAEANRALEMQPRDRKSVV